MTRLPDRIRTLVLEHYSHIGQAVGVTPVNAGNISKTCKIVTDRSTAYIVKVKPTNLFDYQTTVDMHCYLAFLRTHDLPVSTVISTADGRSVVQDGDVLYEVQSYIEHQGNLDDYEYADVSPQVFSLLGRYHHISQTYPHAFARIAYLGDSLLPIGLFAKYFGGALDHAIPRSIASAQAGDSLGKALIADLHYFDHTLRAIQADLERKIDSLPSVINHNDIYGNNLLFRDGQLAGLIDFDFCMTDIYYPDLVEALYYSALLQASEGEYFGLPADGQIRIEHAVTDLRSYFAQNADFPYDGPLLAQLLISKVISLALFPIYEAYPQIEERLEMYRRVKRTIENLQDLGAFEL